MDRKLFTARSLSKSSLVPVYTLLHYLMLPLVLLHLVWRGLKNRAYWQRWRERFGLIEPVGDGQPRLWIHAVSVGEVQAALPVVRALQQRYASARIVVTTTTPTGSDRVVQALDREITHCYIPYDLPGSMRRFLDQARPDLAIIMETELWPNVFRLCRRRAIPVLLANARLSARSAARYRRIGRLVTPLLSDITAIAAQNPYDANRFIDLGAKPHQIHVTGNIKFDVQLPASVRERAGAMRRLWGVNRGIWIAASTHEGEEEQVLDAFTRVLRVLSDCLLVLVPRHPERFPRVASLCRKRGFNTVLRSQSPSSCSTVDVFIGDTMGELHVFYAAADVAFVGGSLVPVGGHNLLEPAALGVPIVMGPHLFNFADISERLCAVGAACKVSDSKALGEVVGKLLQDANLRHHMGENGKRFVAQNRGALERVMTIVERLLNSQNMENHRLTDLESAYHRVHLGEPT